MGIATVHDNYLQIAGIKYFRGNAPSVSIGSYGEKKIPAFSANYLEVQDNILASKLVVKAVTEVVIDTDKSTKASIEHNIKPVGLFSGAAYDAVKLKKLRLIKLDMGLKDVENAVNSSSNVLKDLASYGRDARVAHQIFVVMAAKEASAFMAGGAVTFSRQGGSLQAKVSTGVTTTITLSPGTTYAYLLCKLDWNKGKTKVEKVTDDQWGVS